MTTQLTLALIWASLASTCLGICYWTIRRVDRELDAWEASHRDNRTKGDTP